MKDAIFASLAAVVFWAVLSLVATGNQAGAARHSPRPKEAVTEAAPDAEAPEPGMSAEKTAYDQDCLLPVLVDGTVRTMDLHTYLTGVLLAEIPSTFADEARKAQATASRTYALRSCLHYRHDGAAVCADASCCQGWTDPETVSPSLRAAAEQAVSATDGLVIRYGGELIDATFFSCSGGQTEAAVAVWGRELPYLQAVDSPGEEDATHFTDEIHLSLTAFCTALRKQDPEVSFPERQGAWVGETSYTPGGGVETMELGGRSFTGKELRRLFGLRSTVFTLRLTATEAIFETKGYGHRVGMSQWGAEAMARQGKTFLEILCHYYQGVTIGSAGE